MTILLVRLCKYCTDCLLLYSFFIDSFFRNLCIFFFCFVRFAGQKKFVEGTGMSMVSLLSHVVKIL